MFSPHVMLAALVRWSAGEQHKVIEYLRAENLVLKGQLRGRRVHLSNAARMASRDPRPSLHERYGDHQGYVAAVRAATEKSVRDRVLLPEDAARLIREATDSDVLRPAASR
jgi:hypothetical protein